jgi:hypothetical protein
MRRFTKRLGFPLVMERRYGVECKNGECKAPIIFARYMANPETDIDSSPNVEINPGRLRCPRCGDDSIYAMEDLMEFPPDIQVERFDG